MLFDSGNREQGQGAEVDLLGTLYRNILESVTRRSATFFSRTGAPPSDRSVSPDAPG